MPRQLLQSLKKKKPGLSKQVRMTPIKKVAVKKPVLSKADEEAKLVAAITKWNKAYHTTNNSPVSDSVYDAAKDRLRVLNPKQPLLKAVGAAPLKRQAPVALPTFMGSLEKIYVDEPAVILKWLKAHKSTTYLMTDKLDGISALLVAKDGVLSLFTRGDGSEGTDISHLIPHLQHIPRLQNGIVRGEIVIHNSDFLKRNGTFTGPKKSFENTRNLVGAIGTKTKVIHQAANMGRFYIHEMVKPAASLPKVAAQLRKLGGVIVPYKIVKGVPSVAVVEAYLALRKKQALYEIDGIVLDNMHGSRMSIKTVNEVATATVKEVIWDVSQHGYLIPVVWFTQGVRLAGVTVSKASGHNAKFIKDGKIGPGAIVSITRGGEVIPTILEVISGTKASMPPKGSYVWGPIAKGKTEPTHIVTTLASDNATIDTKKMAIFVTTLKIKNFKQAQLSKVYEAGIDTPAKLVKATAGRFAAAGLGPKQSTELEASIKSALASATLPTMMVASRCFARGFGMTTAKDIYRELGVLMFTLSPTTITKRLSTVSGIGETGIQQFIDGLPAFTKFITAIKWELPKNKPTSVKTGSKLAGVTIVFTGFRDPKLQEFLERNGARITTSVSKNTGYLVRKLGYSNDKTAKAAELKVKVITPEQARSLVQSH